MRTSYHKIVELYGRIYTNITITRGVVSVRNPTYRSLTGRHIDGVDYHPIREVNNIKVPPIREVVRFNNFYIGITTDGNLFLFFTGELFTLESPIVTAMDACIQLYIIVLLENGRLRLINMDKNSGKLITVNDRDIDREIPQHTIMISPIYDELMSGNKSDIPYWLIVTSNNELIVITLGYYSPGRRGDTPDLWYLEVDGVVSNDYPIDHRDIITINNGTILMSDDRIFSVRGGDGRYILAQLNHSIERITDISPLLDDRMVILTDSEELWIIEDDKIRLIDNQDLKDIRPVELASMVDDGNTVILNSIYIQGIDDRVHQINNNEYVEEIT